MEITVHPCFYKGLVPTSSVSEPSTDRLESLSHVDIIKH